jgi:hypothetical protein
VLVTARRRYRGVLALWGVALAALFVLCVLAFAGHHEPHKAFAVIVFAVAAGWSILFGLDPACKGDFLHSRYVLGRSV